jgi:hypothetical protein
MSEEEYQAWVAAANADWEAAEQLRTAGSFALAVFHYSRLRRSASKPSMHSWIGRLSHTAWSSS